MAHEIDHVTGSPRVLSDWSISGDTKKASIVSKKKGWSDIDLSLKLHPIRKDIVPLKDDAAVKNAVRNLLLTNFFERPFQSGLGANLRGLLFEPADAITRIAIKDNVKRVLENHEPRIKVLNVEVRDYPDDNAYQIYVVFKIKENDTEQGVEILLRRLR